MLARLLVLLQVGETFQQFTVGVFQLLPVGQIFALELTALHGTLHGVANHVVAFRGQ